MHYRWEQQDEDQIWKIFNHRGSERLKNIFKDIRTIDKQPAWISDAVWAGLKAYWNGEDFQKKRATNVCNRGSNAGGMTHSGGSIPATETKRRMVKACYVLL